eukprot:8880907-Pyramimonas_sp.AAC.1
MTFFGQLARRAGKYPVRQSVFEPGSLTFKQPTGPRERGRPRQTLGRMVMKSCSDVAGTPA